MIDYRAARDAWDAYNDKARDQGSGFTQEQVTGAVAMLLWLTDIYLPAQPKPAWLVPDGYQPDGVGACRSCHDHVLWVHTRAGKRAPLNPDGTSHFATCPQAPSWRTPQPYRHELGAHEQPAPARAEDATGR